MAHKTLPLSDLQFRTGKSRERSVVAAPCRHAAEPPAELPDCRDGPRHIAEPATATVGLTLR